VDELEYAHVWASRWPVDGKVTWNCYVNSVEIVIGICERFSALLGCGVRRELEVRPIVFTERDFILSVDA